MSKEQKVGLFFLGGILLAFISVEALIGIAIFHPRYNLWVTYKDVGGLNKGDAVRVAGVKKGTVDRIEVGEEDVRVRISLDQGVKLHRDSVARLDFQALSGTRFIAISLGSAQQPILKDGDTLAGEAPAELSELIGQIASVVTSVKDLADSLNRNQDQLMQRVDRMLEENRGALSSVLANLASVTEKLDSGQGTLARLVNDPALYEHADQALARIDGIAADLRQVSSQLAAGNGTLGRLVREDELYQEIRDTVAGLNATVRNLEEISEEIRGGHGTIGRLVTDESLYVEAQDAVRGLDRAAAGIEDQAPISILGTFVSTLF